MIKSRPVRNERPHLEPAVYEALGRRVEVFECLAIRTAAVGLTEVPLDVLQRRCVSPSIRTSSSVAM